MNKRKKIIILGLLCVIFSCLLFSIREKAYGIESTAYTFTLSADSSGYIRTQDAYIPGGSILSEIGLSKPESLFYMSGIIYIADSGNRRIVKYELESGSITYYGDGILEYPTDVSVSKDGRIFIADYGASEIVILSDDGSLLSRISRPEDMLYGKSPYKPKKVDIDSYGNIYAVSEGTHEGILQFNEEGVFHGFFGANKTKGLNLVELFQKKFYTEEQKSKLLFRTPPNIVSLDISYNNLVYTVTQNDRRDAVKKLNMAGNNVLTMAGKLWGENNYIDVSVTKEGFIFAVTNTGSIEEFDESGILLLLFGGRAVSSDRNGLTSVVSGIEVDETYNIYVLDKERGLIQTYYPTYYAKLIHQAETYYGAGYYEDSLNCYSEILRLNPSAYMAHYGYAKVMFQLGEYEIAAKHFKIINQTDLYSDCYFEIRSQWLRENMKSILLVCIGVITVFAILYLIHNKRDFTKQVREWWFNVQKKHHLVKELFIDTFYMIKHPIDCIYYIKTGKRGSASGASILYLTAFTVYLLSRSLTSFVFGGGFTTDTNLLIISLSVVIPVCLFIVGSYLVSSIHDGEGTIKNVYTSIGYGFSAYIVFTPFLTVLSHALTVTDRFIYSFSNFIILSYTFVLMFIAIKETHCYTPKKTISNLILTIVFIVIVIVACIILYILWNELIVFVKEVLEEGRYRAFK